MTTLHPWAEISGCSLPCSSLLHLGARRAAVLAWCRQHAAMQCCRAELLGADLQAPQLRRLQQGSSHRLSRAALYVGDHAVEGLRLEVRLPRAHEVSPACLAFQMSAAGTVQLLLCGLLARNLCLCDSIAAFFSLTSPTHRQL